MAKKSIKQHGGKRAGSGRKPLQDDGDTVKIGASLPAGLVEQLDAFAEKHGINRSEAVREAVGLLLNAK